MIVLPLPADGAAGAVVVLLVMADLALFSNAR